MRDKTPQGMKGVLVKGCMAAIAVVLLCSFPFDARALDDSALFAHKPGIWSIQGKGTLERWIVIHNLTEAKDTGIFHIEVIGHVKGRPSWDIRRICTHMAITKDALKRSVRKPLNRGSVYPEAFDDAYAKWKKDAEAGHKVLCDRSVLQCLPAK